MTTQYTQDNRLPGYEYARRLEESRQRIAEFEGKREPYTHEQLMSTGTSPSILGQNHPAYSRSYWDSAYRRRVGLDVVQDPRQGLRLAALCALLVAVLCAWMFWNANFAQP